jgi:DNA-binding NtrC family response regulator
MDSTVILVVEADPLLRGFLEECLPRYSLAYSSSLELDLTRVIRNRHPQLAILGASMIEASKIRGITGPIRQWNQAIRVLLMAKNGSEDLAVAALRAGIHEYLKYPWDPDEVMEAVQKCLSESTTRKPLEPGSSPRCDSQMIGDSEAMREVRACLGRVASTDSNILITGETGTGKELAAEYVHHNSFRSSQPFIKINCAAIPDSLLESELFGYERGAFTGAEGARDGKMAAAQGGTVFLDEVGDMSLFAQAKILRVIDCKEIQRLGSRRATAVNIRIIAASNQELERLVREDKFRKDLYFRLNVTRIHLPPLRERKEDIPSIVNHFLQDLNVRFGRQVHSLTPILWDHILGYDWPGNVRELRNLLEALLIHTSGSEISPDQLPRQLRERCQCQSSLGDDEGKRLLAALMSTDWNKSKAADKLQWSRMTLYRKMAKYQVPRSKAKLVSNNVKGSMRGSAGECAGGS